MSKLTKQNVGGIDYTMVGCTLTGVCASAAADFVKAVILSDGDVVSDGMTVVVTFANGNTAGSAPVSQTIYSSDQVNYYSDAELTQPFTLAPSGCYTIEYTGEGNAYTYQSYPIIVVGNVSGPLCTTDGKPAGGVVWTDGSSVSLLYTLGKFLVLPSARLTPYCTSADTTVSGGPLVSGGSVKIMFTSALTSADTTTAMVLNYNGVNISVKVPRNGSLVDYKASAVGNVNYFCQAYTTLELIYDGTNFIIVGNPVIYSDTNTTIYADGSIKYTYPKYIVRNTYVGKPAANETIETYDCSTLEQGLYLFVENLLNASYQGMGLFVKTRFSSALQTITLRSSICEMSYDSSTDKISVKNTSGFALELTQTILKIG